MTEGESPIKVEKADEKKLKELDVTSWPIWTKGEATFVWHYDDQEICYLLEGEATIKTNGGKVSIAQGDLVTFPKGLDCTWEVTIPLRKHYKLGNPKR